MIIVLLATDMPSINTSTSLIESIALPFSSTIVAVIVVFLPTFTSNPSIVTSSISYFVIVNVAFAVYEL